MSKLATESLTDKLPLICTSDYHNAWGTLHPDYPLRWICGVCYGINRRQIRAGARFCTNCLAGFSVPGKETDQCPNCTKDTRNTWRYQQLQYWKRLNPHG